MPFQLRKRTVESLVAEFWLRNQREPTWRLYVRRARTVLMMIGAILVVLALMIIVSDAAKDSPAPAWYALSFVIVLTLIGFAGLFLGGKKKASEYVQSGLIVVFSFTAAAVVLRLSDIAYAAVLITVLIPYALFLLFAIGWLLRRSFGTSAPTPVLECLGCGKDVLGDVEWCDDCLGMFDGPPGRES